MEVSTDAISDREQKSLVKQCFEICSTLTDKGFKFSFSLKLGSSFNFSLSSEECSPKAKPRTRSRRPPAFYRRQIRRRAAFLEKKEKLTVPEEAVSENLLDKKVDSKVDNNTPLNLNPRAIYPRGSVESVEQEEDNCEQWSTGGTVTEKPVLASQNVRSCSHFVCPRHDCLLGSEPEEEDQEAGSVDQGGPLASPEGSPNEPQRNQWTSVSHKRQTPKPMTPVRQIPASRSTLAKPLLTDCRHSIYNHKSGTEIIVFAPAEVSYDDVLKAFHPTADWSYVRPTSHRCDKWVYYPKENAENV